MKIVPVISLLVLISSCALRESNTKPDTMAESIVNDVAIQARLMPAVRASETDVPAQAETIRVDSYRKSGFLYFNIRLEKQDMVPDDKTRAYLDFQMQGDFKMVDKDTVLPSMVHRVVNGRKNSYEFIVAFPASEAVMATGPQLEIIYDDKIFGIGRQLFSFKKSDLL